MNTSNLKILRSVFYGFVTEIYIRPPGNTFITAVHEKYISATALNALLYWGLIWTSSPS